MAVCGVAGSASAQTVVAKGTTDPFYMQFFGGINKSTNENMPMTEFTSHPFAGGAFIGFGKEFTPLWGLRGALIYNHNKSRNVQKCESEESWGWDNAGVSLDGTFDLTDAFQRKPNSVKQRVFNLKAFLGVGAAYTFNFDNVPLSYTVPYSRDSRVVPTGRCGLTATLRLSDNWRLGAELSYTMFADRFNGVKDDFPIDGRSNLSVGFAYAFGKKKTRSVAPVTSVVYDNRLRAVPELPFVIPNDEVVKKRSVTGRAFLDFPVNQTVIYPNYRRNPQELNRIVATIDSALFDKTTQVTSITLHGYASPESPYSNNTRLAKGRTVALRDFLCQRYGLDRSLFHLSFTPEDWRNLRGFIADSGRRRTKGDIWYENALIHETPEAPASVIGYKDELLSVIDLNIDPDEKEQKLKEVGNGEPYRWLYTYVYPGLRHTDYEIDYLVRHYPVKQSRKLIYTHPEALSLNEMYAVASSYERGSDGWFDALTIAARQYPESETANLNAASACVQQRRLSEAKRFLANAGSTPEAAYVADVIKAMEGKCQWMLEDGKVVIIEKK